MGTPYVGEIRMFAGNFAPLGWAFCDGQLLAIAENDLLFTLIGTTYGGDGQQTFALPDLRGRVPVHMGNGPGLSTRVIGEMGGAEAVTLSAGQLPAHVHPLLASYAPAEATAEPTNSVTAAANTALYSTNAGQLADMAAAAVRPAGGSQPHENVAPFQCVSFIISLFGIFPSQS